MFGVIFVVGIINIFYVTVVTEAPVAGCTRNEECNTDRMCDRGVCVSPCGFDPCAKYALCIDANHTAVCICITGYSGDPYKETGCSKYMIKFFYSNIIHLVWQLSVTNQVIVYRNKNRFDIYVFIIIMNNWSTF